MFDKYLQLTYNILNKESVSQGKAGHPGFELRFIKKMASLLSEGEGAIFYVIKLA